MLLFGTDLLECRDKMSPKPAREAFSESRRNAVDHPLDICFDVKLATWDFHPFSFRFSVICAHFLISVLH